MANLPVNDGTGSESIKTKSTSHVHVPYSRLQYGSSDTDVDAVAAQGLPVLALDGEIASLGAKGDAAATTDIISASVIAYLKRLCQKLTTISAQIGVTGGSSRASLRPQPGTAQGIAITSTSATSILAAPGASSYLAVNGVVVANTSATAVRVTFSEGSAGATKLVLWAPENGTVSVTLPAPMIIGVNTALYATCSAGVSTIYVSAFGTVTT